MEEICGLKERE